jgi:hypothetical protein
MRVSKLFRRIFLKIAFASYSFLPASQAPVVDADARDRVKAVRPDRFDESEVETGCIPALLADHTRYGGPCTGLGSQLEAMSRANGKGLRLLNSCLSGSIDEEREKFIAQRMLDA